MSLRTDHMQSPEILGLLPLLLHVFLSFDLLNQRIPLFTRNIQPSLVAILQLSPSHGFWVTTQDDVGTTTGHVRRNRHRTEASRLCDDFSFSLVELGIQNAVFNAPTIQHFGESFALFDGNRTHQNWAALLTNFLNFTFVDLSRFFLATFHKADG